MSDSTEQLRNFFGTGENIEWGRNLWGGDKSVAQQEPVVRHDSAKSHISSIRRLNKPLPRNNAGDIDYTSKDMYDVARQDNTYKNLKSNFWHETANLLRWATTFSIGAIFLAAMQLGVAAATVTAAGASGWLSAATLSAAAPMLIPAGIAAVAGASMFVASRKARELFTEKTFDNQEFIIQRQSQLIGKAVETERDAGVNTEWQKRVGGAEQARQNWRDTVTDELNTASAGPAV